MAGNTYKQKWKLDAEDKTGRAMGSLRKNLGGVDKVFSQLKGNMLGVFGAGAMGAALATTVNSTAESLDKLAKRAHALGMASEDLDAWDYAAQLTGSSTEAMEAALRRLPQSMYDAANGSKMAKDAFADLGVQVEDENGNLRDITSVLLDISGGMEGMESSTERAAVASKLLGRSGSQMVNMLKEGPDALRGMLAEAHAMGTRYDALTVKGEEYEDAQLRMNRAFRGTRDAIVGSALPSLATLAEFMAGEVLNATTGLSGEFRQFLGELRVMPAAAALDVIASQEEEIRQQISDTIDLIDERHAQQKALRAEAGAIPQNFGEGGEEFRAVTGAQDEMGASLGELRQQLEALGAEKERLTKRMEALRRQQEFWKNNLDDGTEGVDKLTDAERRAEQVRKSIATATEKFNEAERENLNLLFEGLLTQEEYERAMDQAREALDKADVSQQRHNNLMAAGARVTAENLTPMERYQEHLDFLKTLLDETAISQETFNRAAAAAWVTLQNDLDGFVDGAGHSFDVVESAGTTAVRGIGDALGDMVQLGKQDLTDLGDHATRIANQIINSLIQASLVDPLVAGITAGSGGGGASSSQPPEGFIGPPAPKSFDKSRPYLTGKQGGSEIAVPSSSSMTSAPAGTAAATVLKAEFHIHAIDTATGVEFIQKHRPMILGMMQQAYNKTGQRGPLD